MYTRNLCQCFKYCLMTRQQSSALVCAAIAEQREFEGSLKKRKREFGETLERYEAEVDKYAQRSELSKRDEVAAQVTDLSQKLKEVILLTQSTQWLQPASSLKAAIGPLKRGF